MYTWVVVVLRVLALAALCAFSVVVADLAVRGSVLSHLRPVIVAPRNAAVVRPPVEVEWDGPRQMRLLVRPTGGEPVDAGLYTSPAELPAAFFPREGSYELELRSPRFGSWVGARRRFQVYFASATSAGPPAQPSGLRRERSDGIKELLRALKAARVAREKANERVRFLAEENAALREESERLVRQLETLSNEPQDWTDPAVADLERQVAELSEQNRSMAEELAVLRLRLASIPPCAVWGYYSFPRPNTYPATRRVVVISNAAGQIFRNQAECEFARRSDATAGSLCFCAAGPWG